MKERGVAFLSWLWRLMASIWGLLIVGAVAGILGNIIYTYATTGNITFTDPRTLTLTSWLSAHLLPIIIVFLLVLALTVCSYLAHRDRHRTIQKNQQVHDDALVDVARGVVDIGKGVRTALEERMASPPISPLPPASSMPAQQETSLPASAWNVPYVRNPFFTGREELLKQLHENLAQNKAAASTQPQAISGLGGIGKTQTAVEYAYRYRDEYHYVLWVNAATRDELITSFVELAALLNLPERQEKDQLKIVAAVKHWLTTHDEWLLIFDNADDLALVEDVLPSGGKGHLILTTRAHATGTRANSIEVEKMDSQKGMLLLLRRAKVLALDVPLDNAPIADRTAATAIVQEMDGLPLAIDQAGAFIEETQCSVSDYLQRYRQRQAMLLKRRGGSGKDHPEPVATTWSLSFERVEQLDPLAAELLRCCAFLAPDAIPEQMIIDGVSELGTLLHPIAENVLLLDEALGTLLRFSLVQRKRDERTFFIHRLVQAVLRGSIDAQTQRNYAERMVKAINQAFPDVKDYRNWPRCQQYLPHAQVCVSLIITWEFTFPETGRLLNELGYYLDDRAQYEEAKPLYQRTIAIDEETLGPEHPGLATDLNNLALLYQDQGKYEEAEPLYQRAIAIGEKTLGPEHPNLATWLNNLALLYQHQGKYEEAEPFYQRAIAIGEKTLGLEHPDLAIRLNNLATLYQDQGKYEEAEPLYQRALAIYEQKFGSAHPGTRMIRENYSILLRTMNKQKD